MQQNITKTEISIRHCVLCNKNLKYVAPALGAQNYGQQVDC